MQINFPSFDQVLDGVEISVLTNENKRSRAFNRILMQDLLDEEDECHSPLKQCDWQCLDVGDEFSWVEQMLKTCYGPRAMRDFDDKFPLYSLTIVIHKAPAGMSSLSRRNIFVVISC